MANARRDARRLADRLLAKQRDALRKKEDAARELSSALFDLRDAAERLRTAAATFSAIDGTGRGELRGLLGLTATETNIAFDLKHTYVLANTGDEDDETDGTNPDTGDAGTVGTDVETDADHVPAGDAERPAWQQ